MTMKNEEKINLIKKEALSDEELENISGGGGVLSYAIEAACAALGAYFASVAYDKSIGGFLRDKQVRLSLNWAKTSKAVRYVNIASRWIVISQGAVWAAALADTICEKLHIKK